jgi:hypothetical protein
MLELKNLGRGRHLRKSWEFEVGLTKRDEENDIETRTNERRFTACVDGMLD